MWAEVHDKAPISPGEKAKRQNCSNSKIDYMKMIHLFPAFIFALAIMGGIGIVYTIAGTLGVIAFVGIMYLIYQYLRNEIKWATKEKKTMKALCLGLRLVSESLASLLLDY